MKCLLPVWMLLCCVSMQASAQYNLQENKVWVFGSRTGLDFNASAAQSITTAISGGSGSYEASAAVCDNFGRLLFYTNGENVWSRNHVLMPNGNRLPPASSYSMVSSSGQGAIILPVIDSPGKYYIFSLTCWEQKQASPPYDGQLFYSVVDMSLNGGRGDVVPGRKWIPLDVNLGEKMTAVAGNHNNIWLLVHANDTNLFRAWEVTAAGISAAPVLSYTGLSGMKPQVAVGSVTPPVYANSWWTFGQMAVSPDRRKLVSGYSRANYVELYDFDPCTGTVSNPLMIDTIRQLPGAGSDLTHNGICFSPDSRKIYVAGVKEDFTTGSSRYLYQFDLSSAVPADIIASKTQIGPSSYNGQLRLAPNGKIYTLNTSPVYMTDTLNVIHAPNMPGTACQYVLNDQLLTGGAQIGLGSDFIRPFPVSPDTFWHQQLDTLVCSFLAGGLQLRAPGGFEDYVWDDSTSDSVRTVDAQGRYRVVYYDGCRYTVDSFIIKGTELPPFSLGPDTSLCNADSLLLSIPVPDASYSWQDGSTGQTLAVTESGTYIAAATRDGCSSSDTIAVRLIRRLQQFDDRIAVCNREPVLIRLPAYAPPGADITWSDGSGGQELLIQDTGTYWVTITDAPCTFSDTVRVAGEVCDCYPEMPNAFTPNGDGRNDIFRPFLAAGCVVQQFSLQVYNRWGALVYSGSDPAGGWDGNYKGAPSEAGTYMYHTRITGGSRQKQYEFKGDVTLIR